MYDREALNQYQDMVSQSYGSPVNPNQTPAGEIELRNPLDNGLLAKVSAGAGDPDKDKIEWSEGVEHDDSKINVNFRGWHAYGNKTTSEHRPTPEVAGETDAERAGGNEDSQPESDTDTQGDTELAGTPETAEETPEEGEVTNTTDKAKK